MKSSPTSEFKKKFARSSAAVFFLFCLIAAAGCNRGQHPPDLGKAAPAFVIHDGAQTASLKQYRGRVLLVNFWASWCAPCVQEIPSLIALHRRLPKLAMLGVSIDQSQKAYDNFLVKYRVDFPTIRDPSEAVMHRFGTQQIPETYVIGPSGHILRKYVSSQDWTSPAIVETLQAVIQQKDRGERTFHSLPRDAALSPPRSTIYDSSMTTNMDVSFRYAQHPAEDTMRAVADLYEVYGIRRVRLNREDRTVRVEYDATRFGTDTVFQLLRRAGLSVTERISPFPASPPLEPDSGEATPPAA